MDYWFGSALKGKEMKRNGEEEHIQIRVMVEGPVTVCLFSDSGKDVLDQARDLMEELRWHLEEDSSSLKLTEG